MNQYKSDLLYTRGLKMFTIKASGGVALSMIVMSTH